MHRQRCSHNLLDLNIKTTVITHPESRAGFKHKDRRKKYKVQKMSCEFRKTFNKSFREWYGAWNKHFGVSQEEKDSSYHTTKYHTLL